MNINEQRISGTAMSWPTALTPITLYARKKGPNRTKENQRQVPIFIHFHLLCRLVLRRQVELFEESLSEAREALRRQKVRGLNCVDT